VLFPAPGGALTIKVFEIDNSFLISGIISVTGKLNKVESISFLLKIIFNNN
jgi:hypothetical protein